jgi:hypothetical protein
MVRSWWRRYISRPAVRPSRGAGRVRGRVRPRLALEALETRALLSTFQPILAPPGGVTPLGTSGPTGYAPAQVAHAYGFDQITFTGGVKGDGSGQTIAVVDAYDDPKLLSSTDPNFAGSDLHNFDVQFGLPDPPSFVKVNQAGGTAYPGTDPAGSWEAEEALDVEWAHALAPKANILLVEATDASDTNLYAAVDYAARQPGVVVVSMSWGGSEASTETSLDSHFTTPAGHAGVAFVAASGDSGAPPIYPAVSPNVLAVGGTYLSIDGSGNYLGETGWYGSGGGVSAYEAQPAYQKGVVTQSATQRTSPDVAYGADPGAGFSVYDAYNNAASAPWSDWGGTSAGAPQWSALVAIADQGRQIAGKAPLDGGTGLLPAIYQARAGDFTDIVTGGSTGTPAYAAGPGYDLVTGRGSPLANFLVADLAGTSTGTAVPAYVRTDATTQGTWQGAYGADGYNVVGASASYPAYAQVTPSGQSSWTWAASTSDVRALQVPGSTTARIAACWYSATSFTVDVNLTDGQSHQVALYLLDWDNGGRAERVDVLDASSGAVLGRQAVSGFSGGEYLVFTVSGHVQFRITNLAGPNAVLSGLFFGGAGSTPPPPPSATAAFVKTDATTQGTWQGAYGADGYNVVGTTASYPTYATVAPSGQSSWTWAASTTDVRALQQPGSTTTRIAATWYAGGSFTVDVNLTDGQQHQLALYLLDWDSQGRSERVDVLDASTGSVLGSQTATGFVGGQYLVWNLSGHVQLKFTDLSGPNAVLSGLFFGAAGNPPPPPTPSGTAAFVKADSTTQGTWQGVYGASGYNVIGTTPSYPAYAQVTPSGQSSWTWAASTSDVRALQKPGSTTDRIAAAWYAANSFTIDVNLTDGQAHQLALYLLDWDHQGRSERVDILDTNTGTVLNSQTVSGFGNGEYLVWNLSGHVQIRITDLAGPNAVVSGLFFG